MPSCEPIQRHVNKFTRIVRLAEVVTEDIHNQRITSFTE